VRLELTLDAVQAAAERFQGEMEQMPPPVSAKKVGGRPAYKIARAGGVPELKRVPVTIAEFSIGSLNGDVAAFAMRVSAGGYVRSVAHEMGQALGCGAHLASLRRTASGPFVLADALTLDEVEALGRAGALAARLPHPRTLLPGFPCVTADEQTAGRLRNGMQVNLPEYSQAELVKVFAGQRELVAIGRRVAGTLFQPVVVLA
jgi:tRNA pseudouridine55 synthase